MEGGEKGKQKNGKDEEEKDGEGNSSTGSKHPTQLQEECVSTNRKSPKSDGEGWSVQVAIALGTPKQPTSVPS